MRLLFTRRRIHNQKTLNQRRVIVSATRLLRLYWIVLGGGYPSLSTTQFTSLCDIFGVSITYLFPLNILCVGISLVKRITVF